MATVTAQMILDRAARTLHDDHGVRWTPEDMLSYLSDGQRETVMLKPSAYAVNETVQLTPGTRQELPGQGMTLIDVVRNMGGDGDTPGKAPRVVQRQVIDATRPDWHMDEADMQVKTFMFDDRNPKNFYVSPPQPNPAGHLEIIYAATPPEITEANETIALDDAFQTALYYYVMSRALMKSTAQNANQATYYYELFRAAVTGRTEALVRLNPEQMDQRVDSRAGVAPGGMVG